MVELSGRAKAKTRFRRQTTGGSAVLSHIVPSVELPQQVLHGVSGIQQTGCTLKYVLTANSTPEV
jgi:hypothetical protein